MIRRANTTDIQDLLSLWNEMMRSHKGMHPDFRIAENADVAIASNFTTLFDDSSAAFIVAEEEDKVVGMLIAQVRHGLSYTATEISGYIRDVAVAKSFRGKGIGRELVQAGVEFLKSKNVEYIDLITGSSNNISNDFWQKMGFKETLKVRTLLMGS
ncbi:GNAT family N-acetyltransferase [Candidatus Marinimicrobia bacterium MT.SAG.4]|nr:GNAT family N-acetyltransferase [Candidatus Marinimicrobia bacterium MT.SAG.4]